MIKHFPLATLLLATMASLSTVSAQAANYPWYEVEVYLFERPSATTEHWPSTPLTLNTSKAIDLITPQVAEDITGVSMALSDCSKNNWSNVGSDFGFGAANSSNDAQPTTQQPCHGLHSNDTVVLPHHIPVDIEPKDPFSAVQPNVDKATAMLLSGDKAKFTQDIAKLNRLGDITPLLHMTWQQQMKPRRRAQPLHLFAGKDYSEQFQANGMPVSTEAKTNAYGFADLTEQQQASPVWQFDGLLTIYLNHYLYVETRFNLREPEQKVIKADETTQTAATVLPFLGVMPMEQNRRIRSTEVHYFDHPRIGMLLQVRKMAGPVELPKVEQLPADDSADGHAADANAPTAATPAIEYSDRQPATTPTSSQQ